MTVAIAAICDSGKCVVIASDQMHTDMRTLVNFETQASKLEQITPMSLLLSACDNTSTLRAIVNSVKPRIRELHETPIVRLAEMMRDGYRMVHLQQLDELLIVPSLGPDYVRMRDNGVSLPDYLKNQPSTYERIVLQMSQHNIGVELLVAGIDRLGAHLFRVNHPGVSQNIEQLGYTAIGVGKFHAATRLQVAAQTQFTDLNATLLNVYSAKRASEVAPGVGVKTEMAIINANGIWLSPAAVLDELGALYEKMEKRIENADFANLQELYEMDFKVVQSQTQDPSIPRIPEAEPVQRGSSAKNQPGLGQAP